VISLLHAPEFHRTIVAITKIDAVSTDHQPVKGQTILRLAQQQG
jgi:hypothetical protein